MKKIFPLMLLFATIHTFTACSSDDESENGISKDQLIGLWDATAVQFNNDGKWIDITSRPDLALSITFYEDGSYYGAGALGDGEGTYTLRGNTIKTYVDNDLYGTYVVKSLVGDYAELTLRMDGETMSIKANKSKLNLSPNDPSIIIAKEEGGYISYGDWENETLEGDHFVHQWLGFGYYNDLTWRIDNYTINEKGLYVVTINGKEVRATQNSQTIKHLTFSFDGKTLVTRDDTILQTDYGKIYPSYEEKVYSASVNGNELTISDNSKTTLYTKTAYWLN